MASKSTKYRARKDLFGALFVAAIFAVGCFLLARGELIPWPMADKFGWLFIIFGVIAAWDWWATSYEFDQEELVIRSGLGATRVSFCNIEVLRKSRSSLKLKCQQLRGSKWITVTPRDLNGFVERLGGKCPWLGK